MIHGYHNTMTEDQLDANLAYEAFYKHLLKSPISISTRRDIGLALAAFKRSRNQEDWNAISAQEPKYSQALRTLRSDGCLPIRYAKWESISNQIQQLRTDSSISNDEHLEYYSPQDLLRIPAVKELAQNIHPLGACRA